jgi:phage tail protein X
MDRVTHITSSGEVLDYAAYEYYDYEQHAFDLYEAPENYGLALLDPSLPSGVMVAMLEFPKPSVYSPVVQLWD